MLGMVLAMEVRGRTDILTLYTLFHNCFLPGCYAGFGLKRNAEVRLGTSEKLAVLEGPAQLEYPNHKNLDFDSFVGTMHASLFPNH